MMRITMSISSTLAVGAVAVAVIAQTTILDTQSQTGLAPAV